MSLISKPVKSTSREPVNIVAPLNTIVYKFLVHYKGAGLLYRFNIRYYTNQCTHRYSGYTDIATIACSNILENRFSEHIVYGRTFLVKGPTFLLERMDL